MMGARGKKRRRADGSIARRMSEAQAWDAVDRDNLRRLRETGPPLLIQLADLGFDFDSVRGVPSDMADAYDLARKPKGAQIGAFGPAGRELYRAMAEVDFVDPDWAIFKTGRVVTIASLAEELGFSDGTINKALLSLIGHGFVERTREGRAFRLRPLLPIIALVEAARRQVGLADELPGCVDAIDSHLWRRVIEVFAVELDINP